MIYSLAPNLPANKKKQTCTGQREVIKFKHSVGRKWWSVFLHLVRAVKDRGTSGKLSWHASSTRKKKKNGLGISDKKMSHHPGLHVCWKRSKSLMGMTDVVRGGENMRKRLEQGFFSDWTKITLLQSLYWSVLLNFKVNVSERKLYH